MKKQSLKMTFIAGLMIAGLAEGVRADLTSSYQFNGNGNWSVDGVGGNWTPVGTVQANVPVGAIVEKAFLYSSLWSLAGPIATPAVTFQGTTYSGGQWTSLGHYQPQPGSNPGFWLGAYRTDVTSQITSLVGGGSASTFNFTVNAESPNPNIDGEVLAIVYSLPTETQRTIAFLDGFSNSGGDATTVNFASPLTAAQLADPSFQATLSLGIGFSTGGVQSSLVDINVNGNRLTSAAGGFDDGSGVNGALITVGGIGDNLANPADPNSSSSPDDELYMLNSFLSAGDSSMDILSQNPSLDDNIFFAGLNITAVAGIDQPPPGVPDGGATILLLAVSFLSLGGFRRLTAIRF
jgi:hypothetical protein